MTETLQEFVDSRGVAVRVEREQGVIRGGKILGLQSHNGREYLPEALSRAAPLYEEARVNVNHPKGNPAGPRDYQDRIGVIRNVEPRAGEGLFADFHFNPKHALAEQLVWDAEHAPENVGFSHNVVAKTSQRGGRIVVEAITKVQSVDLVADPATTRGLFESANGDGQPSSAAPVESTTPPGLAELTPELLRKHRPELVETLVDEQKAETARLTAELEQLQAAAAAEGRRRQVRRLLEEYHLPDPNTAEGWARLMVDPAFIRSLEEAPSDEAMRRLVEERARLVREAGATPVTPKQTVSGPVSREQNRVYDTTPADAKTFAQSITVT